MPAMGRRCLLWRTFGLLCWLQAYVDTADVECDFETGVCEFSSNCKAGDCFVPVRAKLADQGPTIDHTTATGDGWYSRVQFSKSAWHESVARLEYSTTGPFCFLAWVHASGLKLPRVEMSSRHEDADWHVDEADKERVFFRAQSSHAELWQKVQYNEERQGAVKVEIRAWHFSNGSVGVDDLALTSGPCPEDPADGSCSFDRSVCGYENAVGGSGNKWRMVPPGRSASRNRAVALDHTTDTMRGGYVHLFVPAGANASRSLISPVLREPKGEHSRCIRFFYYAPPFKHHPGLELYLGRNPGHTLSSDEIATNLEGLWSVDYHSMISGLWMPVEVDFTVRGEHELAFRAYVETPWNSPWYCALDDIDVYACGDQKGEQIWCSFDDGHMCNWTTPLQPSGPAGTWKLSDLAWGEPHLPDTDHTHGTADAGFVYAENKDDSSVLKAVLTSPTLDAGWVGAACLTFWHFAVFNEPGSCNLTVSSLSGDAWWSSAHKLERSWKQEVVRAWLPDDQNQFVLEASLRDALIAVDDIELTFGACSSEQRGLSCDFERGPCTWTNPTVKRETWEWLLRGGPLKSDLPQPLKDHTLSSPKGSFMLVSGRDTMLRGSAELQSEVVDLKAAGAQCMDFWYTVHGSRDAELSFKVTVHQTTPSAAKQSEEIWFHKGGNVTTWQLGRVKIPRQHRVVFEAAVLQSRDGYIALDDISIYINEDCWTIPAEATSGKAAYVLLECSWNTPQRCLWSRPEDIAGTWKLGSRFPPRSALAPATSPDGKPNNFIYLSCEKLHQGSGVVSAFLNSPIVERQQMVVCVRFAFHMFGPARRQLAFALGARQDLASVKSKTSVLFRAFGGSVADRWHHLKRTVRFTSAATTLEFSASSDQCQRGDIALSDIHVTPGPCTNDDTVQGLSDFEHDTRFWYNNNWNHVLTGMSGDMANATLRSGPQDSAGYLQLTSKGAVKTASLTSFVWHAPHHPRSVELWYYGSVTGNWSLSVHLADKTGSPLSRVWNLPSAPEMKTWSLARAEVPVQSEDFKVVIEGKLQPRSGSSAVVAIDNVMLDISPPVHVANCDFQRDLCGYVGSFDSDFRWLVGSGRILRSQPGARTYETISSGHAGRFAYVDPTVPTAPSSKLAATLRSAIFNSSGHENVTVHYFRNGAAFASFKVHQLVGGAKGTSRTLLADLAPGDQWQDVVLPLHPAPECQLEFTLTGSPKEKMGLAAIASITVRSAGKDDQGVTEEPSPDLSCDFDQGNYCLWKSDAGAGGEPLWALNNAATGQPRFPLYDHSKRNHSGRFIFSWNNGSTASVARIKSIPLSRGWSPSSHCFSFWYFMRTDRNSSLSVTLAPSKSYSWSEPGARMATWAPALVRFKETKAAKKAQIVLEASIGSGIVAVDDFSVTLGDCPRTQLCTFEGGVECGHTADMSNVRDWAVQQGSQLGVPDHTLGDVLGHYLYLNTSAVKQSRNSIARIYLPVRDATAGACLTFWWRSHGEQSELSVYRFAQAEGLGNSLASFDTEENLLWNGRSVNITSDRPWQAVFEARFPSYATTGSGVLLDDIELVDGACPDQNYCTFEGSTCIAWQDSNDPYATSQWELQRADLSVFPSDHTTGTPQGHYLRFSAEAPGKLAAIAAGGGSSNGPRCATFWYLLSDELHGLTLLAGPAYFNESTFGQWKSAQFSLTHYHRSIIAVSGTNPKAFVLIDDLLVHEDDCAWQGDYSTTATERTGITAPKVTTDSGAATAAVTSRSAVTAGIESTTAGHTSIVTDTIEHAVTATVSKSPETVTTDIVTTTVPSTLPWTTTAASKSSVTKTESTVASTSVVKVTTPTASVTGENVPPATPSATPETPAPLTTSSSGRGCGIGMFNCRDGAHCVPALLLCDGVRDCPNGADEICGDHQFCPDGHYYCQKPPSCLGRSRLCDGIQDCKDGSDELVCFVCPGYFCRNEGNCGFHPTSGAPNCSCKPGFEGNRCQRQLDMLSPTASARVAGATGPWAYVAPVLALLILGFTVGVVVYVRRKRRNEMEETHQVVVENPIYGLDMSQVNTPRQSRRSTQSWFSRTFRFSNATNISATEC